MSVLVLVSASQCNAQILHKKKKVNKSTDATNTAEPDKQLYDKAINDIKHGRHEVGRLGLQTLINTYPDSEYLAKAKLAIADSYFKEGGTANTTQAVAGYKDFIVFFPFLPEAAYAQMQVAMANYNEMAKADRDSTHAKLAEEEFQTFLQKYPKDPLAPNAEQRLREVQEVLAEGQFRIAYYYYVKGDRRAAAGRLAPLVGRYPLYSKSDEALWMLGDVFEKSERKDVAGGYYFLLVKNYPLSKKAPLAKDKLKSFGVPIPQPDPKAVAWMTAEQNAPRPKETPVHRAMGILHNGPDVHTAAYHGNPQMEPESDNGPTDTLSGGNRTTLVGSSGGAGSSSGSTGSTAVVETVRPGDPAPAKPAGAEDTTSGTSDTATAPNADASAASSTDAATTADPAKTDGPATDSAAADAAKTAAPVAADANNNQKESSSKKKGIKKLIPW
ncbi:MAG TPA: outer membrane protein assembly factor BamD [Candidatus Acidoferrum sp.]|jgi:outer membrane protein assembly factor BamD|nr:outer membrane protein assembly factor BamD [Candidatus Acidoferrum sp.]